MEESETGWSLGVMVGVHSRQAVRALRTVNPQSLCCCPRAPFSFPSLYFKKTVE